MVSGAGGVHRGEKAQGWVSLSDGQTRFSLLLRRFWEEYPKEIEVTAGGEAVNVHFWPRHKTTPVDLRRIDQRLISDYGEFVERHNEGQHWYDYNLRVYQQRNPDMPRHAYTRTGWGTARSHEIIIRIEPARSEEFRGDFDAMKQRPLLYVSPAYNCATGVLGALHPEDHQNFPVLERRLELSWDSLIKCQREWDHWVGMWNYGDVQTAFNDQLGEWGRYYTRFSWRGGEIEIPHTPFLMYFRSSKRKYFRIAEEMARHLRDVGSFDPVVNDGRLMGEGVEVLSSGVRHDMSHWGSSKSVLPGATGGDPDHVFAAGFVDHYFMTGEPRSRDLTVQYAEMVMRKSASYIRGMKEHGHLRGEDQCLRVLAGAYDVTGDEKYRKSVEYFIRHQCEGLNSMTHNRLGKVVRTCTGGAGVQRFYFSFYKQQALNYVYHMTRNAELLEAMTHGYKTYFFEGLLGSGFASLYQGTGEKLYARICALSLRHAAGHAQREVVMPEPTPDRQWCKNPTVMGTHQSNVPYAMAAVYKARLPLHPKEMVGRQFDSYYLAEPAVSVKGTGVLSGPAHRVASGVTALPRPSRADRVGLPSPSSFSPVDLSRVANRDGQSLTYCSEDWGIGRSSAPPRRIANSARICRLASRISSLASSSSASSRISLWLSLAMSPITHLPRPLPQKGPGPPPPRSPAGSTSGPCRRRRAASCGRSRRSAIPPRPRRASAAAPPPPPSVR